MAPILQALDRELSELATSPRVRGALIRWTNSNQELAGNRDLHDVLVRRDAVAFEAIAGTLPVVPSGPTTSDLSRYFFGS